MNKVMRKIYKYQLSVSIDVMEKRHKFYLKLEDIKFKTGEIPKEYIGYYAAWLADSRKHWKKVPGVWKKIKKTAKKNAVTVYNKKYGKGVINANIRTNKNRLEKEIKSNQKSEEKKSN